MIKILVTGSNGQLGKELQRHCSSFPFYKTIFTDIEEMDITNPSIVKEYFTIYNPDYIINCAAYTAVDKAEQEQNLANKINKTGPQIISKVAAETNAFVIHISSDYVFDGKSNQPYTENDLPNPLSIYAKSKYLGELEVKNYATRALIIRTSWLYSEFGNNFVKTIITKGGKGESLPVVYDQIGSPTSACYLAKTIFEIIPELNKNNYFDVYNYSNEGIASWYDFAMAIREISGINCKIEPIETADRPLTGAKRPLYSVLNKKKFKNRFMKEIPYWRESLSECIKKII